MDTRRKLQALGKQTVAVESTGVHGYEQATNMS
jgi:hypothetical protein